MKNICIFAGMIFVLFTTVTSCEDNDSPSGSVEEYEYVNDWIYENMSVYYLWNERMPSAESCVFSSNPEKFFRSICYTYDEKTNPNGDRFSWIQENYVDLLNSLSGVSSDEIGFEFILYYIYKNRPELIGEILYVKKGTPAEANKIKRGQYFTEINGTQLTDGNYSQLISNLKGNYTLSVYEPDDTSLSNKKTYSLSTVSKYEENPIYLDSVYYAGGKRIGYLVYNFFADDNGDGKCKYDAQLAQVFEKFKSNNINSLVLDLRYNSGGSSLAATVLGSMLVKNFSTSNLFYTIKYNSLLTQVITQEEGPEYFNQRFMDKISPDKASNNLTSPIYLTNIGNDLQDLYILTGSNTASASELIINGLKPYMKVTLLGSTTYGKNVGSISIYEENDPKNKWGMQPIIAKMFNKNNESDFTAGFPPDIKNEDDDLGKKNLGNIEESMLREAIQNITGVNSDALRSGSPKEKRTNAVIESSLEKKAWRNKSILKNIRIQQLNR